MVDIAPELRPRPPVVDTTLSARSGETTKVLKRLAKLSRDSETEEAKNPETGENVIVLKHQEGIIRRLLKRKEKTPTSRTENSGQDVERARQLKALWENQNLPLLASAGAAGVQGNISFLEAEILSQRVFIVGASDEIKGSVLRPVDEVGRDARELITRLSDYLSLLPSDLTVEQLNSIVESYLNPLEGKQLYMRPGIGGVTDVLRDGFLSDQVLRERTAQHPEIDFDVYLSGLAPKVAEQVKKLAGEGKIDKLIQHRPFSEYQKKIDEVEKKEFVAIASSIETFSYAASAIALEKIDFDNPATLPLEVQFVLAKNPSLEGVFRGLIGQGFELELQRREFTPKKVLDAISTIAVASQENFIITWLPDLLLSGKMPRLTPTGQGIKQAQHMGIIEADKPINQKTLEEDCRVIQEALGDFISIRPVKSGNLSPQVAEDLARLNGEIGEIRQEYATRRMLFDNAHERTEGAQEVIKKMFYIGPVAHSLEMAHLGMLAKIVTANTDDMMGEYAEIKALKGSGFSTDVLKKRIPLATGALLMAVYGSTQVDPMLQQGHDIEPGLIFGTSAVALSLTTAVQSVKMYHEAARALIEQGKTPALSQLPEPIVKLINSKEFKKRYKEVEDTVQAFDGGKMEEVYDLLRSELVKSNIPKKKADQLIDEYRALDVDIKEIMAEQPSSRDLWSLALRQDFSNPARLGILLGASMAPVAGALAGKAGLMHNGFALALIGSMESIVAGGTVRLARSISDKRYKRFLKDAVSTEKAKVHSTPLPATLAA